MKSPAEFARDQWARFGVADYKEAYAALATLTAAIEQRDREVRAEALEEACTVVAMFFEGDHRPGTSSGEIISRIRSLPTTETPGEG